MNSSQDNERQFKRFMLPRLFGIVAAVRSPKDTGETFPMCSGVIIESRRLLVLVTVAHYLNDLAKWRKQGRLQDVRLLIHHESGICGTIALDLNENQCFCNEFVDLGFVVLSRKVVAEIVEHEGKAVKASATSIVDLPDRFILVGHAASHAQVATDTIATDENAGKEWRCSRLSSLAVVFATLQLDGEGDDAQTFTFTPLASVEDYGGTSGGPIFGYKHGSAIRDYCLYAIQSKQVREGTREQKVKHLIATSGAFAVDAINNILEALDAQ